MRYERLQRGVPRFLHRYLLDFEARMEDAVRQFAAELPPGGRVLDAGAGECKHGPFFSRQRYCGVDLAVGDVEWDYRRLDAIADLLALPFGAGEFDACLNVVTLEHIPEPGCALGEIFRVLRPGGRLLLVAPQEWEVHQAPHDFFRFTRYGIRYLLQKAGFTELRVYPVGGFFRVLSRRLLNGLQFFRGWRMPLAALLLAPPALLLPLLERLDRSRDFTLGYICTAKKPL